MHRTTPHTRIAWPLLLLFVSGNTVAEIYRCEGPGGPVYTDHPCGPEVVIEDTTAGLGGQVLPATLDELQAKKAQRAQRRFAGALYSWRDEEVAAIDRQIAALQASQARSLNNLAGATRSAGIDQQIAALRQARAETVNAVQDQVVGLRQE